MLIEDTLDKKSRTFSPWEAQRLIQGGLERQKKFLSYQSKFMNETTDAVSKNKRM